MGHGTHTFLSSENKWTINDICRFQFKGKDRLYLTPANKHGCTSQQSTQAQ